MESGWTENWQRSLEQFRNATGRVLPGAQLKRFTTSDSTVFFGILTNPVMGEDLGRKIRISHLAPAFLFPYFSTPFLSLWTRQTCFHSTDTPCLVPLFFFFLAVTCVFRSVRAPSNRRLSIISQPYWNVLCWEPSWSLVSALMWRGKKGDRAESWRWDVISLKM